MAINGTAADDVLNGTSRRDIINGLQGNDTMAGGLDHDTYYVDSMLDVVIENFGEGTDWIYSTVSYTLPDNVEHMRLLGTASLNLTGNNWDNTLIGNNGNNILDGGAGADVLMGGLGNDTYYVNQFATNGLNTIKGVHDVIIDTGGIDTVVSTLNSPDFTDLYYIMQNGLENAVFTGNSTAVTITGNTSKNYIITGDKDDIIDGGKGGDTMDGGDGANTFYIDHAQDVVIDTFADDPTGSNADTAIVSAASYTFSPTANIEIINFAAKGVSQVIGSDTDNIITGNTYANRIYGAGGDDTLNGGGGSDLLYGGLGADTFLFSADVFVDSATKPAPVKIMDFNVAEGDILDISDIISYETGTIISSYIDISDSGRDSIVRVNTTGSDDPPSKWLHVATIVGVNGLTGETALFDHGNLILESTT